MFAGFTKWIVAIRSSETAGMCDLGELLFEVTLWGDSLMRRSAQREYCYWQLLTCSASFIPSVSGISISLSTRSKYFPSWMSYFNRSQSGTDHRNPAGQDPAQQRRVPSCEPHKDGGSQKTDGNILEWVCMIFLSEFIEWVACLTEIGLLSWLLRSHDRLCQNDQSYSLQGECHDRITIYVPSVAKREIETGKRSVWKQCKAVSWSEQSSGHPVSDDRCTTAGWGKNVYQSDPGIFSDTPLHFLLLCFRRSHCPSNFRESYRHHLCGCLYLTETPHPCSPLFQAAPLFAFYCWGARQWYHSP
mgnify:CR=1 FL=1